MPDLLTTLGLGLLALLSFSASVLAIRRLHREGGGGRSQHLLVWIVTLGSAAIYFYQAMDNGWRPLAALVDGLALIAALLGVVLIYLQFRPRLEAVSAFALPVLTLILTWAVCASRWTHFDYSTDPRAPVHPVWMNVHLISVFLGTLLSALAAVAGGMFLYVQHRLRLKHDLRGLGRLASLETLESLIIRTATMGFAMLTLALVTGVMIALAGPTRLGEGWWHSPKILLATAAWAVYALVMNVRFASSFRGARAAWLSIVGLLLLLATLGVVNKLAKNGRTTDAPPAATLTLAPETE